MSKFNKSIYDRKHTEVLMGFYMILDALTSILTIGRYTSSFSIDYSTKRLRYGLERRKLMRAVWNKKVAEFRKNNK